MPDTLTRGANSKQARRGREITEQVLTTVASNPGLSAPAIAERIDVHKVTAARHLTRLGAEGRVRVERAQDGKRYHPDAAPVAASDTSGAKTRLERAVVTVIAESPVGLTGLQIAAAAGIKPRYINEILGGLQRRDVLRRVGNTATSPGTWALAKGTA